MSRAPNQASFESETSVESSVAPGRCGSIERTVIQAAR